MTLTFAANDKLQRKSFADKLTTAIEKFYSFSDGAYVLSLNASYGSGKTTFLEMWANDLVAKGFTVLKVDAWKTDFATDPILPIAEEFLKSISGTSPKVKKLKTALQGAIGATAFIGNTALAQFTGVDVLGAIEAVENDLKESDLLEAGKTIHSAYTHKIRAYEKLLATLSDYVETLEKKPLVILVDELDRARPNYSVEFLETIKHLFSVKGVCFVLAVDKNQLKSSIKKLYGNDTDFENYYRRFATIETNFPEIKRADLQPFVRGLFSEFFDQKRTVGIHFTYSEDNRSILLDYFNSVVFAFGLNARQATLLFRIISHLWLVAEPKSLLVTWLRASIFLMAISITDEDLYLKLGKAKASPQEVKNKILGLRYEANSFETTQRFFIIEAMSFILSYQDTKELTKNREDILKIIYTIDGEPSADEKQQRDGQIISMLAKGVGGNWNDVPQKSGFHDIYEVRESWQEFF